MYVVWKKRELKGIQACEFCGARANRGRVAFIPLIVASKRANGTPRQVHVARLASIRSCCLHSDAVLRAWWQQVEATLRTFCKDEATNIRKLLADGIARAKREGSRHHERRESQEGGAHSPGYLAHPLRVLGIRWPCRVEDVKAAFRALAKQTHPDLGGRAEDFRAVSDAYQEVLAALAG